MFFRRAKLFLFIFYFAKKKGKHEKEENLEIDLLPSL